MPFSRVVVGSPAYAVVPQPNRLEVAATARAPVISVVLRMTVVLLCVVGDCQEGYARTPRPVACDFGRIGYWAWETLDMLKSGTRSAGIAVLEK
ncbi:hypothetical protein GCM10023146_06180 [Nocardioides caricicola]